MAYSDGPQVMPWQEEKIARDADRPHLWQSSSPSKGYDNNGKKRNKICGLWVPVFWIMITFLVLLLAAAIGTGLGLGLAAKNDRPSPTIESSPKPSYTTTTTSLSSAVATPLENYKETVDPSDVKTLDLDCPERDASPYTALTNERFTIRCGKDIHASKDRTGTYNILGVIAFSIDACIEACSSYNFYGGNKTDACVGAVLSTYMKDSVNDYYGNCWLKTGRETTDLDDFSAIAAILEN